MTGHVVLVTGGAGAIGLETCAQFLAANAAVVVNGRDAGRCEAAAVQLRGRFPGARVFALAADVSDYAASAALVADVEAAAGRLDGLVHSATGGAPGVLGKFEQTDPAQYLTLMQRSLCTLLNICHAALPALRRAGGGAIVALSSDSGKIAAPNQTLQGATRAGAMMFIRSLALEASADAIRCNCVSPTFVQGTPIFDRMLAQDPQSGRAARAASRAKLGLPTASDIAALTVFLCSPAGAHLTGQVISVNGGLSAA
ncbi:SDR family NAD(P)-dependent oxidoreductase [Phenylobacterium sp.]|uniref:SDR family NAD(P)-dependent oxidoreductase n=1 Tax=Phenylobacterium sp. TaxID=1871053 RepID=UPI002F3FD506